MYAKQDPIAHVMLVHRISESCSLGNLCISHVGWITDVRLSVIAFVLGGCSLFVVVLFVPVTYWDFNSPF